MSVLNVPFGCSGSVSIQNITRHCEQVYKLMEYNSVIETMQS